MFHRKFKFVFLQKKTLMFLEKNETCLKNMFFIIKLSEKHIC